MKDWGTYRKLFENPPPAFERLPFTVRCMAAEILRRCDRVGRIIPATGMGDALVTDLAFHVRAHPGEEDFLRRCLVALLDDKYLVFESGHLVIRNFVPAQRSESADRMAKKRARDATQTGDSVTSRDEQNRSDATAVTSRVRASSRFVSSGLVSSGSDPDPEQAEDQVEIPPEAPSRVQRTELPTSLESALLLPVCERASVCIQRGDIAEWIEPGKWPEVTGAARILCDAMGLSVPKFGTYAKDSGLRVFIELFAAGNDLDAFRLAAKAIPVDTFLAKHRRLSAVTPEVFRNLIAAAEKTTSTARPTDAAAREAARKSQESEKALLDDIKRKRAEADAKAQHKPTGTEAQ